ncbi:MAG: PAS domain S-box protein [Deltaproteobacteria bacterium]|nr:PAS domain S-box protein [Deltaproteobacteria bacterium]
MGDTPAYLNLEDRIKELEEEISCLKKQDIIRRESEEMLRALFNGSQDAIFISDANARFVDVNAAATVLTGYSKEELVEMSLQDLYDHVGSEDFHKLFDRILRGETLNSEAKLRRKNGAKIDAKLSNRRVMVQGVPYLHIVARDITEQKRAVTSLQESEARYRTLFERNPIETIIVDNDGRVIRYNLAKKRSGNRLPDIGDIMYKDYASRHEIDMYGELMDCIRRSESKDFPELKYYDRFLRINISPFPGGAIITSIDISDYKRVEEALRLSEARFRTAFETSPDAISIIRMSDGIYVDINEGFTELTGYTREEVINKSSFEVSIWNDPNDRTNFMKTLEKQGYIRNMEVKLRLKDERLRIGLKSARIMLWNNEPHILSVTRDIDDLKKAEEEVRKMEQDRKQKERLQIILETAGAVCHELNQPLMAISGYSELLLMKTSEEDPLRDKIAKILEQANRMGEITGKLMGITKYKTKSYGGGEKIIDIEKASQ